MARPRVLLADDHPIVIEGMRALLKDECELVGTVGDGPSLVASAIAIVPEIIVACPKPDAVVMAAARIAGVSRLFRMGGAQAIAAMAYGTATVPRVDKIVGPGNQYVAAAKALVAGDCAIDFYAGPTEILIVSDNGNPEWIAADLIAQAEHDPHARAIFVTSRRTLALSVARAIASA